MRLEIEVGFSFKRALDEGYRRLEVPDGVDVEGAIRAWLEQNPRAKARVLDDAGKIRPNINALINGSNVTLREGFRTPLEEGDRLTILPPVGGG